MDWHPCAGFALLCRSVTVQILLTTFDSQNVKQLHGIEHNIDVLWWGMGGKTRLENTLAWQNWYRLELQTRPNQMKRIDAWLWSNLFELRSEFGRLNWHVPSLMPALPPWGWGSSSVAHHQNLGFHIKRLSPLLIKRLVFRCWRAYNGTYWLWNNERYCSIEINIWNSLKDDADLDYFNS